MNTMESDSSADQKKIKKSARSGLTKIAFWQFMCFLFLILLLWVDALLDLPLLWFGIPTKDSSVVSAAVLSGVVLVIAFITIGQAFEQQKRILRGFFIYCSYCHKVRIEHEAWKGIDEFVIEHSSAQISHGICPECYSNMIASYTARKMEEPRKAGPN